MTRRQDVSLLSSSGVRNYSRTSLEITLGNIYAGKGMYGKMFFNNETVLLKNII